MKISAGADTKIVPIALPGRPDLTCRRVSVLQTSTNAWLVFLEMLSVPDPISPVGSNICFPASPGHWRKSFFLLRDPGRAGYGGERLVSASQNLWEVHVGDSRSDPR